MTSKGTSRGTSTLGRDEDTNTRPNTKSSVIVLCAFIVLVAATALIGGWLNRRLGMKINAAPLFARWRPHWGPGIPLAAGVALTVVWFDTRRSERVRFGPFLVLCAAAAIVWSCALALVDGTDGLLMGITGRNDYLANLARIDGSADFVRTFTSRIGGYTIHTQGHPPGTVLILSWLDRFGLATPGSLAGLLVFAGASIVPATLLAVRTIADETVARRAAPFLVLAPAAIWLVVTFDALYAAVGAWGICSLVVATASVGRRRDALALSGGLLLGAGLFMSYGILLLGLVPFAVIASRRDTRTLFIAATGVITIAAAFAMSGFWWFDGLAATRAAYVSGVANVRPYAYFVFANLAAFGIAAGLGAIRGLAGLRDGRLWVLCGAALFAIALADLSGLSKGEVERIWLPFWPWLAVAAASIPDLERSRWLAAQALVAIGLQSALFLPW